MRDFLNKNKIFFETIGILLLTGLGIWIAWNQNILFTNQNQIMERQTELMENQTKIMEREYLPIFKFSTNFSFNKEIHYFMDHNKLIISNIGSPANDFSADFCTFLQLTIRNYYSSSNKQIQSLELPIYDYYTDGILYHEWTGKMIEFIDRAGEEKEAMFLSGWLVNHTTYEEYNSLYGGGNWITLLNICDDWGWYIEDNKLGDGGCTLNQYIAITYIDVFENQHEDYYKINMVTDWFSRGNIFAYKIPNELGKSKFEVFDSEIRNGFDLYSDSNCTVIRKAHDYDSEWDRCKVNWTKYIDLENFSVLYNNN